MKYVSVKKSNNKCETGYTLIIKYKKGYTLIMTVPDADFIFVSSLVHIICRSRRKRNLDKVIRIIKYFKPTTISVNFVFF